MVDELAQESQYSLKVNMYFCSRFYDRHLKTLNGKIRHLNNYGAHLNQLEYSSE